MFTVEKEIIIKNKQGLHARPAAVFVQVANTFDSEITVRKDSKEVNGKSIMGILMLAAEEKSIVYVKASGSDAKEAIEKLERILISQTEDFTSDNIGGKKAKRKNK